MKKFWMMMYLVFCCWLFGIWYSGILNISSSSNHLVRIRTNPSMINIQSAWRNFIILGFSLGNPNTYTYIPRTGKLELQNCFFKIWTQIPRFFRIPRWAVLLFRIKFLFFLFLKKWEQFFGCDPWICVSKPSWT